MGEARTSKFFEFMRSTFWGIFSSHSGEIDDQTMECYGEKTRNALYTGYGMSRKGRRRDFIKLDSFKKGFNKPLDCIEDEE